MYRKHWIIISVLIAGIVACNKNIISSNESFTGFQKPAYFPEPVYDFAANPVTQAGFNLAANFFTTPFYRLITKSVAEAVTFRHLPLHTTDTM